MDDNNIKKKQLEIIKRKDWIILVAVLLLFAALIVWSFYGVVQTTSESEGITFHLTGDNNTYVAVPVDRESIHMVKVEETKAHILPDWENRDGKTYITGTASFVSSIPLNAQELEESMRAQSTLEKLPEDEKLNEELYKLMSDEYKRSYMVFFRLEKEDGKYVLSNGETLTEFPGAEFCDVIVILNESSPYEIYFSGGQ